MDYNEYHRQYQNARYKCRMEEARRQLGGCCGVCGTTENLQFDHKDRSSKGMTITDMKCYSEVRFQEELVKCQLLCVTCHNQKTVQEVWGGPSPHGALRKYQSGCRCDLCVENYRTYNREYQRRIKGYKPKVAREILHGTYGRYRKGCRCYECKAANSEKMRKYRGARPSG